MNELNLHNKFFFTNQALTICLSWLKLYSCD